MQTTTSISSCRTGGVRQITLLKSVLAEEVLDEMTAVLTRLPKNESLPLILCSSHPTIFAAGADLAEIAQLGTETCIGYAERGRRVVRLLWDYPAPTVAAVSGSCFGGGVDLVLACDRIVAGRETFFQHPGVRRGLVTGWSGTTFLPSALGPSAARSILVGGRPASAREMKGLGLVHKISDQPELEAVEAAISLDALYPERIALWRSLRKPGFIDRFRATVVHKLR